MNQDFLIEMGFPGLTGRLKRLSDSFVYSTREYYRSHGLEIEPNWHMIFLLLKKNKQLTITEIAEALHLTHPAIVQLVNKMKKKGYITATKDPKDQRKSQLMLSKKALNKLPEIETYWKAGNKGLEEIMEHRDHILKELSILENNLEKEDFKERSERILKVLSQKQSSST